MRKAGRSTKAILKNKFTLSQSRRKNNEYSKKDQSVLFAYTPFLDKRELEMKAVNNGWGSIGDDLNSG